MLGERVKRFLEDNRINYTTISHPLAYSAQRTAHSVHIPGREVAKTIIVKINGRMTMVVLTANQKVNMTMLKNVFSTKDVELARENEFAEKFPDCEPGAMPPFGILYNMDEIISEDLTNDDDIVFNAGSHDELIKMKFSDFKKLIKARILDFKIKW